MTVKEAAGVAGGLLIWGALLLVAFGLVSIFVLGGVWIGERLLPFLASASYVTLALVVFLVLPLAIFDATRGFAAIALLVASYIFGATLWFMGLLFTYVTWGIGAVILGLVLLGGGVVPIAMIAATVKGQWPILLTLVLLVVATFGSRLGALKLGETRD